MWRRARLFPNTCLAPVVKAQSAAAATEAENAAGGEMRPRHQLTHTRLKYDCGRSPPSLTGRYRRGSSEGTRGVDRVSL